MRAMFAAFILLMAFALGSIVDVPYRALLAPATMPSTFHYLMQVYVSDAEKPLSYGRYDREHCELARDYVMAQSHGQAVCVPLLRQAPN